MTDDEIRKMLEKAAPGPWDVRPCEREWDRPDVVRLPSGAPDDSGDWLASVVTEPDARLMAAAPELAREVLRLRRILAVEQGDTSAAPTGWKFNIAVDYDWTHEGHSSDIMKGRGRWYWYHCDVERGVAPTALEAMEAADRAAKETP